MKKIESLGGPLIGINREDLKRWGGVERLSFFSSTSRSDNDYDHLCFEANEEGCMVVAKSVTPWGEVVIINYPIPTVIVDSAINSIYIAQIDGFEPGWSSNELCGFDFERSISWQDSFQIQLRGGELVFFDAAYAELDLNDGTLSAKVEAGCYQCEWARQSWDGKADMNFIRIIRQK